MILRRFLLAIILPVFMLGMSVMFFIWSIIRGIRDGLLWTVITTTPLIIMAMWKAMFVGLITLDGDLVMKTYHDEVEGL